MSIDHKLHQAQVAIIHVLLFKPVASFAELQKASQLPSDHFAFHVKQLLSSGLVVKNTDGNYALTVVGKEFANRFDTDARVVERQPKVAVCLAIQADDGRTLMQQRLKNPYYGYWGRPTGKLRWGETVIEAAARELLEETNLQANLVFCGIYHKLDHNSETGALLEDKIFFMVHGHNPRGDLYKEFEGGRNQWMDENEVLALKKSFVNAENFAVSGDGACFFNEKRHHYDIADY